jgi:hypothetical protein
MRGQLAAAFLLVSITSSSSSTAQTAAADVPLTYEAFKGLTPQQAARRLIGASSDLVTTMIIGWPPVGGNLSVVRFFTKPKAAEPGLCQLNEIDVLFETGDGRPMGSANAATLMKISGLTSSNRYFVVGDLNTRFNEQQRRDLDPVCGALDTPLQFFPVDSTLHAWEAAYLVDVAIKDARAHGPQSLNITCSDTV